MALYAVVDTTGHVVNTVAWDGVSQWEPPAGTTAIEDPDNKVSPGWTYADGMFVPPPPPPPTAQQLFNPTFNAGSSMREILTA